MIWFCRSVQYPKLTSSTDLLLQYLFGKGAPFKMIAYEESRNSANEECFAAQTRKVIRNKVIYARSPSSVKLSALLFSLFIHYFVTGATQDNHCDTNCLNPRRPETEELFDKLGHHETSASLAVTMAKLDVRLYHQTFYYIILSWIALLALQ